MNASGITRRLVGFANLLVGHIRGGLAMVPFWAADLIVLLLATYLPPISLWIPHLYLSR